MDHQINDYIVGFLSRKATAEDVQQLKTWLEADSAHRDELKEWFRAWDAAGIADNSYSPEEAYRRFMFRLHRDEIPSGHSIRESRFGTTFRTIRRMAAVFAFGFMAGLMAWFFLSKHQQSQNRPVDIAFVESIVPLGAKSEIRLPDGTSVWLNAGSKLRYPTNYGATTRDIYLEGEGYFKVAKQPDKPFIVHTPMMNVKALGTEFNVKAYPNDKTIEATLVTGEILVDKGEKDSAVDRPVILKPGQKFSISLQATTTHAEPSQPVAEKLATDRKPLTLLKQLPPAVADAEVSWKERNWRIETEELQSLAIKLERRYDVVIKIADRLKSYRFSGTLKDESLEQVLTAMRFSAPILFSIKGKEVNIYVDEKKLK
jgi:ferric-dicitrate binding protein FerR (iron transport regulator)